MQDYKRNVSDYVKNIMDFNQGYLRDFKIVNEILRS